MQIRSTFVVHALLATSLWTAPSLLAQADASAKLESFDAIAQEYKEANDAWMKSYRAASKGGATKEEMSKLRAERPEAKDWAARVNKILAAKPASDEGGRAAAWMISRARVTGRDLGRSLEVLAKHHLESDSIRDILLSLSRNPAPAVTRFFEKAEKATGGEMKARVCMAFAQHLKRKASMSRQLADADETESVRMAGYFGRETVDVLKTVDSAAIEKRAAAQYRLIIADEQMSAVDHYGGTIGKAAKSALFELENLSIGKVAPDIVGEDLDGTPMKLSDYRGKVVVIDFWGDW